MLRTARLLMARLSYSPTWEPRTLASRWGALRCNNVDGISRCDANAVLRMWLAQSGIRRAGCDVHPLVCVALYSPEGGRGLWTLSSG